ncbi:MAG: VTT domain-containing protein [Chloroflexi bacterium]|nr:VTT domain-containing protein [Chloroflexota bacterium]
MSHQNARLATCQLLWRKYAVHLGALLFSVGITTVIFFFRDQIASLYSFGYLGILIISILGNATIILPVPSLAVTFAGGGVFNPLYVGLIAGLGEPLGELTGYLAGYGGSAVVQDTRRFALLKEWMSRRGFITLFILSAIPNPLFDLAGIAAGALHYPMPKFLLACWLGKSIKAIAVAYLGSLSFDFLRPFLR